MKQNDSGLDALGTQSLVTNLAGSINDRQFAEVYESWRAACYHRLRRWFNHQDTEDILQEATLRILAFLRRGNVVRHLCALLDRTGVHIGKNQLRRRKALSLSSDASDLIVDAQECHEKLVESIDERMALVRKLDGTEADLELIRKSAEDQRDLEAKLLKHIIELVLSKIPLQQAKVMGLKLQGLNYGTIAAILGLKESVPHTYHYRGLKRACHLFKAIRKKRDKAA